MTTDKYPNIHGIGDPDIQMGSGVTEESMNYANREATLIECPPCTGFESGRQDDCNYCGGAGEILISEIESLNFDDVCSDIEESKATLFSLGEVDRSIDEWEVILISEIRKSIKVIEAASNALVFLNGEDDGYKSKILISDSSLPKRSRTLDQVINKINSDPTGDV